MIGHRLRLSRSAAGLSLRDLEARIDHRVSAQAISKYERNESMPGSGVLIALADALDVTVDYLVADEELVLEAVEFRKKRLTGRRQEARVEARVLHLLERYLTVEEILGLPSVVWDKPREAPWPVVRDLSEAEHAALGLRIHWDLGHDPVPNLVELLEERGIKVLAMDLGDIDGLTARVRREKGAPRDGCRCQPARLGRTTALHAGPRGRPHGSGRLSVPQGGEGRTPLRRSLSHAGRAAARRNRQAS